VRSASMARSISALIGRAGFGATPIPQEGTVDPVFYAYMDAHGDGRWFAQVPEPDTSAACPIDGATSCAEGGDLAIARVRLMDRLHEPPKRWAWLPPLVECARAGRVRPEDYHLVAAAEQVGVDWRIVAAVRVDGLAVPYHAWWDTEPYPSPGLPPRRLPPEPTPTVQTPSVVRSWVLSRVETGTLHLPGMLPDLAVRKRIREQAGLTQAQMGELVGVSKSAIGYYENGRDPEDDWITRRYGEALAEHRNAALGADHPVADVPGLTRDHGGSCARTAG
jgi:DNA-binding XRE family transcriptional regulator